LDFPSEIEFETISRLRTARLPKPRPKNAHARRFYTAGRQRFKTEITGWLNHPGSRRFPSTDTGSIDLQRETFVFVRFDNARTFGFDIGLRAPFLFTDGALVANSQLSYNDAVHNHRPNDSSPRQIVN